MNKIMVFVAYFIIMMILPFLIFSLPIPSEILNDGELTHMIYYAMFSIAGFISLTIGYLKINELLKP